MVKKRQLAVIYFDNNKILFYSKDLPNVLQMNLTSEMISDLEIINTDKLSELITNFFSTNNLKNFEFDCILVFSPNTTFEKDLKAGDTKLKYEETQKFLEMVPFEDIISNTYSIGKQSKIVAVNKALYDQTKINFEKNKAFVFLTVPMSILIVNYPSLNANVDLSFIASKAESIKQYSLTGFNQTGLEGEIKTSVGIKKKDIRLVALLGVLGILFLVFLFMLYSTFFTQPKKPRIIPVKKLKVIKTENNLATSPANFATPSSLLESSTSAKTQ